MSKSKKPEHVQFTYRRAIKGEVVPACYSWWPDETDAKYVANAINLGTHFETWGKRMNNWVVPNNGWVVIEEPKRNEYGEIHP